MDNFTFLLRSSVLVACIFISTGTFSQTTIDSEHFESGWGIWNDGGVDCIRRSTAQGSPTGSFSIRLRDNTGTSRMNSDPLNITSYTSIDFTFDYHALGMENGEDFWVRYYDGSTWHTIGSYISGTDFNNGSTYTETITITAGAPFTFASNSQFRIQCDASADDDQVFIDYVDIIGYSTPNAEINILGNGTTINDGDTTPTTLDDTDFGSEDTASGSNPNTFTIQNTGAIALNLTDASPYVTISGAHAADFTLTANPTTPIASSGSTTFTITFNPSAAGLRTATVSIANDDSNENPYNFSIQGTGTIASPEINIQGNATTITDGDTTPTTADDTDFGSLGAGGTLDHTFTIQNTGTLTLNLTGGTPLVDISGDAAFTILTQPSAATIATSSSLTFVVRFAPTVNGTVQADISIDNDDSNENPYIFRVQGTGVASLTEGPGGVTADLELWLKGTDGLSYSDGQSVSLWIDQGRGADATVNIPGHEPTYRDNPTKNVNFNPVVEFDNSYGTYTLDSDYSYDNSSTQFLEGASGMYTQDIFVVMIPDDTPITNNFGFMDIFCGDENAGANETDATGIGAGYYTARFSGEIFCYAVGTTSGGNGYGVAEIGTGSSYDNIGIINARNNTAVTQQELYYNANDIETSQNDLPDFSNVNDSQYWIGRSEGWEASTNGRIAEIITFSSRKDDTDLTSERNRIQSYLAVKYGITLGVNGTSQDYVDSNGAVIWDQSANSGYNYDVAGIGRDDDSDLYQKQSSSSNNGADGTGPTEGVLSIGLTDIYNTNNENLTTNTANTISDKDFLMWGNNGVDLNITAATVTVDMSAGIPGLTTNVNFTGMQRIWKVIEKGDIGTTKVSILTSAVRNITPPGDYLMFISDTGIFDPTADYRIMSENGSSLETDYDFDGTKYITFGYAPHTIVERSIYFDGVIDYVDVDDALNLNSSDFTISTWIKRGASSANTSILSKRDAAYTEGYDLKINGSGQVEMSWKNGSTQTITSDVVIPVNEWHQVAIIYSSGDTRLYIDGVLDKSATLSDPINTAKSFNIAAADKSTSFFEGNIDEVRIWNTALTLDQLRYIMNQEIEDNSNFVDGKVIPQAISKNEVSTIPWNDLSGYYPMSVYAYTNTNDESGNSNHGALINLDTVDFQTAPLPYESQADGSWTTDATWLNHDVQTLPNTFSIVDGVTPIDWNIVETNHNVTIDTYSGLGRERSVLGLMVNSNELQVNGSTASGTGNGLTVTHYLKLDGTLDLEGESQLIQTTGSDLDVTSAGTLERDQQGTADTYTYNYWAAPVGVSNIITNNNSYTLPDVMNDGASNIDFITTGYDGTNTSPIGIADYWIWKFSNQPSDDYSSWQHVRSTGSLQPGEGFTMKGPGTGSILTPQNYVFNGKPNNGDINLTISASNDYLVGNPYASAIDAEQFILDNGNTVAGTGATTGTLYFWEHWGGGSHILEEYQGGYGTYNLSGGTPSASMGTNDPDVGTGGTPTKTPGRYIPVGQGFFVTAENAGTITFNNGQRVFQKEGGTSTFMRAAENTKNGSPLNSSRGAQLNQDQRMKLRIGFNSVNTIYRQLLLTIDDNCTDGVDWGYDGKLNENLIDDAYWMIDNEKYNIQARDDIESETILPIGIHTNNDGNNKFSVDDLENIPNEVDVYLHDIDLEVFHDLKTSDYEIYLPAGEYLDRFEITFSVNESLSEQDSESQNIDTHFSNAIKSIIVVNPTLKQIRSIEMTNILGQSIYNTQNLPNTNYIELKINNLSAGTYIINLKTEHEVLTKKVMVE